MDDKLIYNPLPKEVHVKIFGQHFSFSAGQIKRMRGEFGDFAVKEKGYLGLVELPEQFDSPSFASSDEGKAILEEKKKEGINKRVVHLQAQVHNLTVSLRSDLDMKNLKIDPMVLATKGDLAAMEELVDYQRAAQDEEKQKVEHAKALERKLKALSTGSINKKD